MKRRGFLAALPAAWVAWRQRGGLPETPGPTVQAVVDPIPSDWVRVIATANTSGTETITTYVQRWTVDSRWREPVATGTFSNTPTVTVTRIGD